MRIYSLISRPHARFPESITLDNLKPRIISQTDAYTLIYRELHAHADPALLHMKEIDFAFLFSVISYMLFPIEYLHFYV